MKEQTRIELYKQAIDQWGINAQTLMVIEETGELLNALAKHSRSRSSVEDIITELADVSIMVEQMATYFGWRSYIGERERKLERLRERLNK